MSDMNIRRGDVFLVDFGQSCAAGHGKRPALVVQNNIGNKYSNTVIVVPGTSKKKRMDMPTHVNIGRLRGMWRTETVFLCENVETISVKQIIHYIDTLTERQMDKVDDALNVSLGLTKKWRDA